MCGEMKLKIKGMSGVMNGIITMVANNASKLPMTVSFTASKPFPSNKSLCPGNTPNAMSASGAPRKIDGIESTKVWVMAMAMMKMPKGMGVVNFNKMGEKVMSKTLMRLT